ncbi:hypothetical protein KFL_006430030 [Klebsormidium nitens]|uniref:PIN domain-containing protein n=1 Tax=Klebsormidium nitens TaxID=105231 RepID=A0A1Y1INW0_KLENI|nr:hypothetical protein KFL_006430030 [Klebsormidium nitens]|eukprot:GAQ90466.1 hypothetical protein KFL_006430030 [Klebsormidium nitens]
MSNPGSFVRPFVSFDAAGDCFVDTEEIGPDNQRLYLDTNVVSKVLTERGNRQILQEFAWRAADRLQVFIPPTVVWEFSRTPGFPWGIPDDFIPAVEGYDEQVVDSVVEDLFAKVDAVEENFEDWTTNMMEHSSWFETRRAEQVVFVTRALKRKQEEGELPPERRAKIPKVHFVCDAAAVDFMQNAAPDSAAGQLYQDHQTYAAYSSVKTRLKCWPAPGIVSRDEELIKEINSLPTGPQLMSSLQTFLTACEHVPELVKKHRVFVTGDRAFFALLQGKGTKEKLDDMINRAGGGCAVKYICFVPNMPRVWELPLLQDPSSFGVLEGSNLQAAPEALNEAGNGVRGSQTNPQERAGIQEANIDQAKLADDPKKKTSLGSAQPGGQGRPGQPAQAPGGAG